MKQPFTIMWQSALSFFKMQRINAKKWLLSTTAMRRLDLFILYLTVVTVSLLAFHAVEVSSQKALRTAIAAKREVNQHNELLKSFRAEKVCSDTNQGQACRDLFMRLRSNISNTQRFKLACMVLDQTQQKEIFDKIGCLPVPPAARP